MHPERSGLNPTNLISWGEINIDIGRSVHHCNNILKAMSLIDSITTRMRPKGLPSQECSQENLMLMLNSMSMLKI